MIKLFEMFAGYGGASFALKKAGMPFECVGVSEIDKYAVQCYNQNFPNVKNFWDCTKINPDELPDFDLLTGGFPCQDVSIAGKRDLSRGRTNLYTEILRIAEAKKPKYMLLENVKGLLSMEIDEMKLVSVIVRDLQKMGYGVCWKVLNSRDYGIPQNRERIWIVCKLGGWEFMEFMFPEKVELKTTVKDLLVQNIKRHEIKNRRLNQILRFPTGKKEMMFELTGDTPSGLSRQCDRIYSLKISPCLNCTQKEYLFYDDGDVISLVPKECFRLMGFLDDGINLDGLSDTSKYKLVGNGWDINLVSKIFKRMFKDG